MRNLVPQFIADQLRDEQLDGVLLAAGLFIDMSGFTLMTDALMTHGQGGSEVLAIIMRRVFDPLIGYVEAHGGFVIAFEGDAFHALFPMPAGDRSAAADDALAAAWEMQQWMAAHPNQETPYGRFAISAKVGLALGDVRWGILTSETGERAIYYFQGHAIEESAAAQAHAQRGEIVLDREIRGALTVDVTPVVRTDDSTAEPAYFRLVEAPRSLPLARSLEPLNPDPEIAALFVSPEIAGQMVSGEFRHAVSLFVRLAHEPTIADLKPFIDQVFTLQDRYGGLLSRLSFGDKGATLLLFWGAPTSHENDIVRALSFALDLRTEAGLEFSAGVTYRIAHAGFVGGERREDYTCYSRGVNLAARLMTTAPVGSIWLDAPTAERAGDAFDLSDLGVRPFKGFEADQAVYALLCRSQNPVKRFEGVLVGRQDDLAQLFAFVEPLRTGRSPGALIIWGEAGMGKSRLMDAFLSNPDGPQAAGALVALCQSDQILRQSLNPFRYWLRHYFDQSDDPLTNRRTFQQRLDELIAEIGAHAGDGEALAAELQRTRSFLSALVNLYEPGSLYDQLDAQSRFENTLQALTALLQAESLRRSVILYVEDAHWLDEDSRDFIAGLARTLATEGGGKHPIAVIVTARPQAGRDLFAELEPRQDVRLAGLSVGDFAALAAEVLGGKAAPDLLDFLTARADGNPFFADQLVRYLQDHEALILGPDGWSLLAQVVERTPAPDDVQALLVARLDQLATDVRSVVQTAAVLGREFELRVLSAMLRSDDQLPRKVKAAEHAAIWSSLEAMRYLFQHALLRDAAYDMQVYSRLAAFHALAASGLLAVYATDLAPHYADLAYHYGRAGDIPSERRYARLAGERAASQYANVEAVRLLARALELTPSDELQARYDLLVLLERVHDLLGQRVEQWADLEALVAVSDALGDRQLSAETALRMANCARVTGDLVAARRHIVRAAANGDDAIAARANALLARIALHSGDYAEALRWLGQVSATAIQVGDRSVEAQALYDMGIGHYYLERFAEAMRYFREAGPIYRECGDRRGEINVLLMFGTIYSRQGDHDAARKQLDAALSLCHELGWRHGETYVLGNLANSYFDLGDYATTRQLHERTLVLARDIGDREGEAASLSTLALVAQRLGDAAAALDLYRQASAIQNEVGYLRGEGYTLTGMGHALADLGDFAAAERAFKDALEIRRSLDPESPLAVDDLAGLALVELRRGNTPRAVLYADEAVTWMEARGASGIEFPVQAWLICYRAFVASTAQGSDASARAQTALARGRALLLEQAAAISDDQLRRTFLHDIPFHRELLHEWRLRDDG